jgi:NAD(P)-dependent dehydrogenase (short-subunit alcohol dehydrogenase family)
MTKRVLITGAAGGIGSFAAAEMRRRGALVVGLDLKAGENIIACDIRDQEAVDKGVAEAIGRLGGLDVVINNAGIGTPQSAGTAPDGGALAVLDVNVVGAWRITAAALPTLRASRGRVVNVSSGLAFLAVPFSTAYCISKRGLVAYSDCLRAEYGDEITVTTVYPGYIRTGIHAESTAAGIQLEGAVPVENVEAAGRALARAALGRPVRDLATTRRGGLSYGLLRRVPQGVIDRAVRAQVRRHARAGAYSDTGLAGDFVQRMRRR